MLQTFDLVKPRQQCATCAAITLKRLTDAPSISLRHNHAGLPPDEHRNALFSTLPLSLSVSLLERTRGSCSTCNFLCTAIQHKVPPDCDFITIYQCKNLEDKLGEVYIYEGFTDKCVARAKCFADEGNDIQPMQRTRHSHFLLGTRASQHILHRPVPPSASKASIKGIRAWLKTCDSRHPQCNCTLAGNKVERLPMLPTRVIDIQERPTSVRLVTTSGQRARYVALGHCWGGTSQVRTTKITLQVHHNQINVQTLPQTLQDAICVTKSLNIRHIWIDSLCIIQEDPDDFNKESRKMASVYERAYFTIAATAATDGAKGLFQVRELHHYVKVLCDFQKPQSGFMYFSIWNEDEENAISDAPLNRRGWVLQERLFSRRTLHFARNQVYWECDELFVGQDRSDHQSIMEIKCTTRSLIRCILDDFRGFRRDPHHVNENPFNKYSDLHSMWAMIVKTYCNCGLSDPNDKLSAVLSLTLELEAIFGHRFHQGHWFDGTPFTLAGLLWRGLEDRVLTRPLPLRASTWSWASTEGPIEFADG